jgi:acyl transferase domain-containing protein
VGEVAAAQVAGIYTLEEAVRIAAVRGRAMEPAKGHGGMAAVELPEEKVAAQIADLALEIAAVNAPSSTVIAGAPAALDEAAKRLGSFRRLHLDYAFHTAQMEPFDAEVEASLADLAPRAAAIPMVSTVTGGRVTGTELDGAYWQANVRRPVRFRDAMGALAGHSVFVEIGPHPVLASSIDACADGASTVLASLRRNRGERETMLEALARLYCAGVPIDWRGVFPDGGRLVRLPTYPFQRQRYWFSPGEAPQPSPVSKPAGGDGEVERILAAQLEAFQRMVAQQLAALGDS